MNKLLTIIGIKRKGKQEQRLTQINRPCSPLTCTANRRQIFKRYNYCFRRESKASLSETG